MIRPNACCQYMLGMRPARVMMLWQGEMLTHGLLIAPKSSGLCRQWGTVLLSPPCSKLHFLVSTQNPLLDKLHIPWRFHVWNKWKFHGPMGGIIQMGVELFRFHGWQWVELLGCQWVELVGIPCVARGGISGIPRVAMRGISGIPWVECGIAVLWRWVGKRLQQRLGKKGKG